MVFGVYHFAFASCRYLPQAVLGNIRKSPSIIKSDTKENIEPCPPVPGLVTQDTWQGEATTLDTNSSRLPLHHEIISTFDNNINMFISQSTMCHLCSSEPNV